jgi:hypothetical protein
LLGNFLRKKVNIKRQKNIIKLRAAQFIKHAIAAWIYQEDGDEDAERLLKSTCDRIATLLWSRNFAEQKMLMQVYILKDCSLGIKGL